MADHGTTTRFKRGCDCGPCRLAWNDYQSHVRRQKAYGRWPAWGGRIDAEPARRHVRALQEAGMGVHQISRLSGVNIGTIFPLLYGDAAEGLGPTKRIAPERAEALLSVTATMDTLAAGAVMDGTGTRRRLQALAAIGWPAAALGERLGRPATSIRRTRRSTTVLVANAREIRDLYDDLWDQPPPMSTPEERGGATRARQHADRSGWAPPMAWDDDTIDDPDAVPVGVVEAVTSYRKLPDPDELAWLHYELRETIPALCQRFSVKPDAVRKCLEKARVAA